MKQLYEQQPRALSQEKVKNVKKLLKYVPPVYHSWYSRLEANTVDTAVHMYEDELLGQSDVEADEADQEVTPVSDEVLPQHTVASEVFSVDSLISMLTQNIDKQQHQISTFLVQSCRFQRSVIALKLSEISCCSLMASNFFF